MSIDKKTKLCMVSRFHLAIPQSIKKLVSTNDLKLIVELKVVIPDREGFHMAQFIVLQHITYVAPYANEHMEMLRLTNGRMTQKWLANEHIKRFPQWLKDKVKASLRIRNVDRLVQVLGYDPQNVVTTYQGYDINGYDSSIVVPMFKCKWVDNRRGVKVDEDGFTLVNLSTHGYVLEPFVLAKQANKVFFVEDSMNPRWQCTLGVENVVDKEEYNQLDNLPPFSIDIPSINVDINVVAYLRSDHNEGSYVERSNREGHDTQGWK
ncbi:hypothetical protein LXL04_019480 [Taraxacum kok-saghyz]